MKELHGAAAVHSFNDLPKFRAANTRYREIKPCKTKFGLVVNDYTYFKLP